MSSWVYDQGITRFQPPSCVCRIFCTIHFAAFQNNYILDYYRLYLPRKGGYASQMKKKILMLMLEVGLGHKIPAIAVKEDLETKYPDLFEISVVDFAKESGASRADTQLKKGWDIALTFPVLARIGYLYIEMNRQNFDYIETLYRDFINKGMHYIAKAKPDVIMATHPLCLYIASKARRKFGGNYKIISYVVDPFDGYSLWANPESDMFLVATEQSKKRLLDSGVCDSKILITGFPIRKQFFNLTKTKEQVYAELGLDPAKLMILVSGGGRGISNVYAFAKIAKRKNLPINMVVVAGKNQRIKKSLDTLAKIQNEMNFVPLAYVNNMNELIAASDVVAGKAGASTFMEAVFMNKPMIFTQWAAHNDWYIINFALENQLGWYCPNSISFLNILKKLSEDSDLLRSSVANIKALHFLPGTEVVADLLAEQAGVTPKPTP